MEKETIQTAIKNFTQANLTENAINLFKSLGYNTSRNNPLPQKTFDYFKSAFPLPETFNAQKAGTSEWKYFDILFQLSNTEIAGQNELWDNRQIDNKLIESYLFVVISLTKNEYSRSHLARICREVNKIFPMPVLVLFRYGAYITLSVIDRRINKRRGDKDVLEHVTLIKDISIDNPHRAHIEILFDFSFNELAVKYPVTNFVELHDAWQKILDTKELNKRFYRELSHWYFWAMQKVVFPNPHNEEDHNAKSLIRLLTRLLFVWFVKEKGLVPPELFDESFVAGLLKTFDPRNEHGIKNQMKSSGAVNNSGYYRAVLQNLFFATLNQECGQRAFRKKGQNQNVTTLFRYEDYFTDVRKFKTLLDTVPFMNGGLFECLDKPDQIKKGKEGGVLINHEDGFSDRADNVLCVPDYLFFSRDEHADISAELDDTRLKDVKVDGLLTILNKYKFTVAENTPIEEDIALDPELLGRVFENLLASYNPETKTSARKQTGSFYTPREIVDYMTDISIKAYLQQKLIEKAGMNGTEADAALELLIGYYESEHVFNDAQIAVLIDAIDTCKILDPACGSGAFPMGVLHKLTFILGKLDPHNKLWAQKQREKAEKIDDADIRDKTIADIEAAFARNELDYGRKLYLVENCIFGVDIQSIAIQISKLRFFISLIVDQKTDSSRDNFGVRPLPNLETKFVAANTLIGLEKPPEATALFNEHKELDAYKAALKNVRHRLFSTKTPATKNKFRAEDKAIRGQIAQILIDDRWSDASAKQIAAWEIDDQNASSSWFDGEWMFGVDGGFDVVIGNPPYLKERDNKKYFDIVNSTAFGRFYHQGKMDYWFYFLHKAIDLTSGNGIITFITSRYWLNSTGATKLIKRVSDQLSVISFVDFGNIKTFENVLGYHMVSLYSKVSSNNNVLYKKVKNLNAIFANTSNEDVSVEILKKDKIITSKYQIILDNRVQLVDTITLGDVCTVSQGVVEAPDRISKKSLKMADNRNVFFGQGVFVLTEAEKTALSLSPEEEQIVKKYLDGRDINRYTLSFAETYLIYADKEAKQKIQYNKDYRNIKNHLDAMSVYITSSNGPYGIHRPRNREYFEHEKIITPSMFKENKFAYDTEAHYVGMSFNIITKSNKNFPLIYLLGILNSKYALSWFYRNGKHRGAGVDIGVDKLREFPLPKSNNKREQIISIVDQIIALKAADPQTDTRGLEARIDGMVYKLYGLTEEEIKVMEGKG
ncbi:hypothetical protein AGMMS50267_02260 [Spirochaetia bacterium]|nr:hypothetical protein AGMMS50267_02260 [Spirochaetia bacterium]